jgi:NADH:ubiquinone oxidoreductase subunit 4 (subunit M)
MTRTEAITLAPLAVLIVVLGLFPSLLLDLLRAPADAFLQAAAAVVR